MDNKQYIRRLSFFSELDDESIDKILGLMIERKYKKNMIIFMEGETAEGVFFIKRGKVKIFKTTQEGKEHIIHIMSDGEIFAESCLFVGGTYPASSETIEDSEIYMIRNSDLEKLLEKYPKIAIHIISVMGRRLKLVSKQIENLALRDAYGKAAALIIQLIKDQGLELKNNIVLKTHLSRQDMGNMVGLTRETFTRALSMLKHNGAIDIDKDEIIVLNVDKLRGWM
ncbi:Crp/Fnr family transcriptional regulator [Fonticella tunisiensis]|uniref:CRP/FNR family transcriptional regulator n=1 Tax=Fonticella tunisiensis TaxID=1096341 RepID=A0A4R7K405_9CLOT|nr:Crp/Fnr family transcriptional regulator [Fonticella tunisiensis]TDT45640.1 CRP/FNR family transcriptional regulator [Fonticella tunisiensis]